MATSDNHPTQLHGSGALQGLAAQSVSGVAPASSPSVRMDSFAPPIVFSPARTHYDELLGRTIPGTTGLLLDCYLFPVDSSSAPSLASSSVRSFLPSGADPLTAITPLNARLSSVWALEHQGVDSQVLKQQMYI